VFGDNRPGYPVQKQPYVFHKIIDRIVKLNPRAVFSTGDYVLGSENKVELNRMYDEFFNVSEKFGDIPLYFIPGNHDMEDTEEFKSEYVRRFGPTYHYVDIENCRFIMLSSEEPGEKRKITGKQFEWLTARLEEAREKDHIFVFVHEPLYPKISHFKTSLDEYPEERDKLAALFKEYKVDMVFAGHCHIYNYSVIDGLHQIITGGAGAGLHAGNEENGGIYHFIYVRIGHDDVDYRIVSVTNEIGIAAELRRKGLYEKCIKISEEAMIIVPEHPEPYISAALAYYYLNDNENFQKMFEKIVEYQGDELEAMLSLGFTAYRTDRKNDFAEELFKKAVEKQPKHFLVYYMLGIVQSSRKQYESAIDYFKKAIELIKDPDFEKEIERRMKRAETLLKERK